jgi:uncharacterized protein involved in type VI secretion and phage assembly
MKAAYSNAAVQIALGGAAIDPEQARRATSVLVRQRLSVPSVAEISFAEPSKEFVASLRYGSGLRIGVAPHATVFEGEITSIEYQRDGAEGRVIRVRAYDRLHRLRKRQRARVIAKVSVSQFIAETVAEFDLECKAAETGPVRGLIVQHDQSDLDLLAALAAEAGLFFYLEGSIVRLVSLAGEGDAIELKVGRDLSKARAVASAESMRRGTQARAWDVLRTAVIAGSASVARQDADDMRSMDLSAFGGLGERFLFNRVASAAEEVQALAQADLDRGAARELIVEATAVGNPDLRPGRAIRIVGLDEHVDGIFAITEAVHTFSEESGYLSTFSTEPPTIARAMSNGPAFTIGTVFDLTDPDRLSRVRARLPLYGDVESDWMPAVIAGAGSDKGFSVFPEVNDTVLIVFPQGDPAYGLVLGGLFGDRKSPGLVDGGARPFVFRTGNGQIITLDAAKGIARIETSGGDLLELGPNGAHIRATQDFLIEAPGRTLTIRANAVEFERS